jgi:hypothetical protein
VWLIDNDFRHLPPPSRMIVTRRDFPGTGDGMALPVIAGLNSAIHHFREEDGCPGQARA